MSLALKPYPVYRDVSLPWAPAIPAHWKVELSKRLFVRVQRSVRPSDEVVTCFRDGTVTLRKNRRVEGFTESLKEIGYQGVRSGDLVIHAMDASAGAIGVSDSDGKSTPVYAICRPKPGINAHFYADVLREMARSQWIAALARGIRERSTDFRYETFANEFVPQPPSDEQDAIAAFIRHLDASTRKIIRAKRRVIELLNEQKHAIIHHAVTRGLESNIRLRPSGIEWLGYVPECWPVMPLKRALSSLDYGISDAGSANGSIPVLGMANIKDGKVTPHSPGGVDRVDPHLLLKPGDLLFNRTNSPELVGKVGLFRGSEKPTTFASYLVRLRPAANADVEFLNYLFNSPGLLRTARQLAIPSLHQSNLNPSRYGRINIALPPLREQKSIAAYLGSELSEVEQLVESTVREIGLLNEYRTRLIVDVVTGKLDVRGVGLPEAEHVGTPVTDGEAEPEEELVAAMESDDAAN